MDLRGNTFLVSGGSSGLGAACVRRFAAAGANVLIADINRDAGQRLADELGSSVRFVATDVTDDGSVRQAVDQGIATFKALHGSVQCAGIAPAEKVLGKDAPSPLDTFTRTIQINLIGTYNVIRWAAFAMARNGAGRDGERGVIINTASVSAFEGQIGQAAYAASKGGIVGMTLPLAREFSRRGIRVVAIAPGIFDTPLMAGLPEPARQSLGAQVPFPSRLGQPEEFAALAQHILENRMLNGAVLRLDGALRMAPK